MHQRKLFSIDARGTAQFVLGLTFAACISNSQGCEKNSVNPLSPQVIARSRLSDGDLSLLQRALVKARRGEPVTIGFIGGSITRGERASSISRGYADLVGRWWIDQFPGSTITLVNAGVSGTNSAYGCLRVQRDLLSQHPDFVVVEFGVNDKDDLAHVETYEGIVRQHMADADRPAVLLLFLMHHDGTNAQRLQSAVGLQYRLPMISYRDALWPEIAAGRMQLGDCFADTVHPNDRGHAAIATFIISLLQQTLDHLPADVAVPAAALPPPRFSGLFTKAKLIAAGDLKPVSNDGWVFDSASASWRSNVPGSSIEFDVSGQVIDLLYAKKDGGYGTASVTVDGEDPLTCDSWLNGPWGPMCQTDVISRSELSGPHRVRITLLAVKNPMSTGNEFHILGLGTASP